MDIEEHGSGQQVNKCFSGESDERAVYSKDFDPELLQIESLSIVNSSSVQFGNNYYSGPVTINHVQPPTQTETDVQSQSTEDKQNVEETSKNTEWYRQLLPRSNRHRCTAAGTVCAVLLATAVCAYTLITLTGTETYDYTKPFNESFDFDPNRTHIYERSVWTSRKSKQGMETLKTPVALVIINHSATPGCSDFEGCAKRIRGFQEYHMDKLGFDDIGYNFLIGGDGRIYEGIGWDKVGAHAYGFNRKSIGICVIGNFEKIHPTSQQIESVHKLIELGVRLKKISADYRVIGLKQVRATDSPGKNLFTLMTMWPHFGLQSSK